MGQQLPSIGQAVLGELAKGLLAPGVGSPGPEPLLGGR